MTVRPTGHPYDRKVQFEGDELCWVRKEALAGSEFLVVDEGPGLSGSTFLAVGDALVAAGVARQRIVLLSSRVPDSDALLAPDGGRRWREFRAHSSTLSLELPREAKIDVGGGQWRRHFHAADEALWPACWPAMERRKLLSQDGRRLFKFEGLGRFGAENLERAARLFRVGFGLPPREEGDGFVSYPRLSGRPLHVSDCGASLLVRLADYCAVRASTFPAKAPVAGEIDAMVRANFLAEFGRERGGGEPLEILRPIFADGRMMPHEWVRAPSGDILKVDAVSHGDDHFFPGPTDIAWDLAGAIVEWRMNREARRLFLARYEHASGDRAEARLPAYLVAYTLFRLAYSKMAAEAVGDSDEAPRLRGDYRRYRAILSEFALRSGSR